MNDDYVVVPRAEFERLFELAERSDRHLSRRFDDIRCLVETMRPMMDVLSNQLPGDPVVRQAQAITNDVVLDLYRMIQEYDDD